MINLLSQNAHLIALLTKLEESAAEENVRAEARLCLRLTGYFSDSIITFLCLVSYENTVILAVSWLLLAVGA